MLPVVVGSHPGSPWLTECLMSIRRPVYVHKTGGYELTALRAAAQHFDRFLFLHDSVRILDDTFWDVVEGLEGTWLTGWPPMYMGVHDAARLRPVLDLAPLNPSKWDSIEWETIITGLLDYDTLWPDVTDFHALRREQKHGRDNLVLGNGLFEKCKGTFA